MGDLVVLGVVTKWDRGGQNDVNDTSEIDIRRLDTEHVDLFDCEWVAGEDAADRLTIDGVLNRPGETGDSESAVLATRFLGQEKSGSTRRVAAKLATAHLQMGQALDETELLDGLTRVLVSHIGRVRDRLVLVTMRLVIVTDDTGRVSARREDHVELQCGAHVTLFFLPSWA